MGVGEVDPIPRVVDNETNTATGGLRIQEADGVISPIGATM
jgi:hypothetical protein